jgi:hypothetical protein
MNCLKGISHTPLSTNKCNQLVRCKACLSVTRVVAINMSVSAPYCTQVLTFFIVSDKLKTIQEAKETAEKSCEYVIKWMCGAPMSWSRISHPE